MKRTILAEVEGWTPIIDSMASLHGLIHAAIFGRVWRFCQMEDGVCRASTHTIAEFLGLDRATICRHLEVLVEEGYLKDLTPELRNRPHIYADTGKASLKLSIAAENKGFATVAQRNSQSETVAQSNTGVAESNSAVAQSNTTVAESRMSKSIKRLSKKQENRLNAALPREPRPRDLHFEALADITGLMPPERDWKQLTRTAAGQLHRYAKELRDVGATPEQIAGFRQWFKRNDWRGKANQSPAPVDVVKLWSQYLNGEKPNGTHRNSNPQDPERQARLQRLADAINQRRRERAKAARAGGGS